MDFNIKYIKGNPLEICSSRDFTLFSKEKLESLYESLLKEWELQIQNHIEGNKFKYEFETYIKIQALTKLLRVVIDKLQTPFDEKMLYLLESKKRMLYKIGVTKNIEQRIPQIIKETGIDDIEIKHIIHKGSFLERTLHKKFSKYNVPIVNKSGRIHKEWFEINEEIEFYFRNYGPKE